MEKDQEEVSTGAQVEDVPTVPLSANAMTTVERAKLMLGIEDGEDEAENARTDAILAMLINRASAWIEQQAGRHFGKHTYVQWYKADGQQELVLEEWPIVDVEYVKEDGKLVSPFAYDYSQTGRIGVIYKDTGWLYDGYRCGLAYDVIAISRNIEVKYTAGYVLPKDATDDDPQTLPSDLEGLVWDMVSGYFTDLMNGAQGLSAFAISDVHWTFDKSSSNLDAWKAIVNLYRRY